MPLGQFRPALYHIQEGISEIGSVTNNKKGIINILNLTHKNPVFTQNICSYGITLYLVKTISANNRGVWYYSTFLRNKNSANFMGSPCTERHNRKILLRDWITIDQHGFSIVPFFCPLFSSIQGGEIARFQKIALFYAKKFLLKIFLELKCLNVSSFFKNWSREKINKNLRYIFTPH